jgi:sulfur-oxidizing protein SoxY
MINSTRKRFSQYLLAGAVLLAPLAQAAVPADPYGSVMWKAMVETYFTGGDVVFDQRVIVHAPASAENQMHVPITVDATQLENVKQIVAVADLNPIQHVLTVRPEQALSFIGFRLKLQQSSPIHVGVQTEDGRWHIGGALVDAAGGGCTAPAAAHGTHNWMASLGETRALVRRDSEGIARMTVRMRHPMDTGLASGIPVFYMNKMVVKDEAGGVVAELDLFEPVSENPTITLKPSVGKTSSKLTVSTRDTEGNEFAFPLSVPAVAQQ